MNAKILEIFPSIQGEGVYAGVKQVFVRFFECHMHCVWCDTPDSIGDAKREYKEYSQAELAKELRSLANGCHSASLTGGEPLLQVDFIKEFIPQIRQAGLKVYLETSGVLYRSLQKIITEVDIIAMDIKLPSSTQQRAFWKEHEEFLKTAVQKDVFIKAVISSKTDLADIKKAADLISSIKKDVPVILQPNTYDLNNGAMQKCARFYDYCLNYLSDVRIVPQIHKFLNIK